VVHLLRQAGHSSTISTHHRPSWRSWVLMDPLKDLVNNSRPVILYDQIGNGRSIRLPGKPTSFWSIDLFVAELENAYQILLLNQLRHCRSLLGTNAGCGVRLSLSTIPGIFWGAQDGVCRCEPPEDPFDPVPGATPWTVSR